MENDKLYELVGNIVKDPDEFLFDLSWFSDYFTNFNHPAVENLFSLRLKSPFKEAFLDKTFVIPVQQLNLINKVVVNCTRYGVCALFGFLYYKCAKGHVMNSLEYVNFKKTIEKDMEYINDKYCLNLKTLKDLKSSLVSILTKVGQKKEKMSSLKLNLDYKLLMIEGERTLLNDEIQKKR